MRWIVGLLVSLAVVDAVFLALFPAPVDPVAWEPAPDPGLSDDFAPNDRLAAVELLLQGVAEGPEDVYCGPGGEFYTGLRDGRILLFAADGEYSELANTGGRPLGMQLDARGQLIVADAMRGLLSVSPEGDIEVLADSVGGEKMLFVDDLDGSLRHNLQDSGAGFNNITSANECDGVLYLGSLTMPAVARYRLQ